MLVVDNASTDGTGEWLAGAPGRRPSTVARTLADNTGGAGGFHEGLRLGGRARRRPGLADGRRRPAGRRTASPRCSRTRATSTSGARSSSTRPTRAGWSSRSGCPAAPASCTRWRDVERRRRRRADPRRGDPVQRRAGHPRARRADRAAARGVLHLGRRPRVPPARRARPAPGSPPSSTPACGTPASGDLGTPMMFGRTTYNHTPERPQALLHGAQQPASTCASTAAGRTRWRSSPRPLWFYTLHPAATRRRLRLSVGAMARRPARRLHRPPEVPVR